MHVRKGLAVFLILVMSSPIFGASPVLGNVTMSKMASIRDTKLTSGSTVFSGDAISVGESGSVRIALTGGAQAEILSDSLVRLEKSGETVQMAVDRGQMSFHTSGDNKIEGRLTDAIVRPADSKEVSAIIQTFADRHAVVASEKGTLLVTTMHDSRTITVREGEAAELSVVPASDAPNPPQSSGPPAAGKSAPAISRTGVIVTGVVIAGAAAITAYFLARNEPAQSNVGNEISPTKLN